MALELSQMIIWELDDATRRNGLMGVLRDIT